ncbi:PLAC8 family-domain-containing protein [Dunaliella salina]|uniref:PLAC8 family-domain-containing protein n=1 Tax=Dunaliella salina TaxID=3046 RepID=A0ABQ7GXY2_DUNSA|nr:PLAC8 family-domain-containing protein [Dunaliella salina]|eukprot:KAF5839460.1 PLAC8 family-domain-containing protein [Dunaliella salina]
MAAPAYGGSSLPPLQPPRGGFSQAPMSMPGGYGGGMQGGGMGFGGSQPQPQSPLGPQFSTYNNPQFQPQPPPIQPPVFSPSMSPTVQSPTNSTQGGFGGGMGLQRPSVGVQGTPQGNGGPQFGPSPSNQGLSGLSAQPSFNSNAAMPQGMQQPFLPQQQPSFGGVGSASMQAPYGQSMGAGSAQFNNPAAQMNGGMPGMGQPNYGSFAMGGGGMGGPMATNMANNAAGLVKSPVTRSVPEQWRTGIAGCFEDCFICGVGSCLTGFLYGENYRKIYGYGFTCACLMYTIMPCFACCFANTTRAELRKKYNLVEEPCGDCCIHFFCSPCAVCQEARELRIRERWISMS